MGLLHAEETVAVWHSVVYSVVEELTKRSQVLINSDVGLYCNM